MKLRSLMSVYVEFPNMPSISFTILAETLQSYFLERSLFVISFESEIPRRGAFAKGALRKVVANCAPNLRKIAGVSFRTSHEGCAKLSRTCRKFESKFRTILCKYPFSKAPSSKSPLNLRTLFPLTAFKNAPNPKFVQNLSRRLLFGVPIRGTQFCQKFVENLKNDNFRTNFQIFVKFLTNLGPPDWNPEQQSSGQILDKFGVRGVFECCKGKRVRNPKHLLGQNFPSKGKLGECSLRGKIFPLRDHFPLRIAFPFPQNRQVFPSNQDFEKKGIFMASGKIYDFPPRGKIYLKPFFFLKRG